MRFDKAGFETGATEQVRISQLGAVDSFLSAWLKSARFRRLHLPLSPYTLYYVLAS